MASSDAFIIICAKQNITEGFRYGPYKGKIREVSPTERNIESLWKLSNGEGSPGYAIECSDPALPPWMRYFKSTNVETEQNMRVLDGGDHFFFEATKDIATGVEYALLGKVMLENQNGMGAQDAGDALSTLLNESSTPENSISGVSELGAGDFTIESENSNMTKSKQAEATSDPPAKRRKYRTRAKLDLSHLELSGKRSHRCSQCGKVFVSSQSFMKHRQECGTGYTHSQLNVEDTGEEEEEDGGEGSANEEGEEDEEDKAEALPPKRVLRRGRRKRRRRHVYNEYKHECEECGRKFLKKQALIEHQKRHFTEKDFGCCAFNCDDKYATLGELVAHIRAKHRDIEGDLYLCIPCNKSFVTLEEMKEHINTHEKQKKMKEDCVPLTLDETLKYLCEYCDRPFQTVSWMEAHREKHSTANIAIFVCHICYEAFKFVTPYEEHMRSHEELTRLQRLQAEKFRCDNCHKAFRSMQMLEKHEKMFGDGLQRKPTFKCDYCGKRLTQAGLENHIQKYHPKENPFKCTEQECILTFKTKEDRGAHLKEVHEIDPNRAFVCPVTNCNKAYASETTMTYHYQRVHTDDRPFSCEICGKGWVKLSKLKEHLLTHTTEKNELCEICGRAFKTRPELRDHRIEMHTTAGKIKLQCRFCPATFSRRSSRSYHERRHKGEAPYICPKPGCNKRFIAVIDYKRHLIYHTGAKLYRCKFCGNSFTRSDYLRGHEKKHHAKGEELDMGPPIEETVTIKVPWPMEKAVRIQGQNVKVVIEPDPSLNNPEAALSAEAVAALEGAMVEAGHVHIVEGTHIPISSEVAAGIIQHVGSDAAGNIVQVVTSAGQPIAAVMQQLPPESVQSVVTNVIQPSNTGTRVVQVVTDGQFVEQQTNATTTEYVQVQNQQVVQEAVEQSRQFTEQDVTAVQVGVEYSGQQQQSVEYVEQQHGVEYVTEAQVQYTDQQQQNVDYTDEQQQQAEVEAAQQLLAQAEAAAVAATQAVQQEQQMIEGTEAEQNNEALQTVDLDEITQNYMQV